MKRRKRYRYKFLQIFIFLLLAAAGIGAAFVLTSSAVAALVVRKTAAWYLPGAVITYKSLSGNLWRGVIIRGLDISGCSRLPYRSELSVQAVGFRKGLWGERDFQLEVENARLKFPVSESIMIWGTYRNRTLDINIYAHRIDVREIEDALAGFGLKLRKAEGLLTEADVRLYGTFTALSAEGKFKMPKLSVNNFTAQDTSGRLKMNLAFRGGFKPKGVLSFDKGRIFGARTAAVELKPGRIIYDGDPRNPALDLHGRAKVADVTMEITLAGTFKSPDLQLVSVPPLPESKLLLMLVTNKALSGSRQDFKDGELPVDVVTDFIDYFAFGGMGGRMAEQLGISDFSLRVDSRGQGFGVSKDIFSNLKATYGVEQTRPQNGEVGFTTQKLGGELKIDKDTSIGVEQRIKQPTLKTSDESNQNKNQDLMIKIKRGF